MFKKAQRILCVAILLTFLVIGCSIKFTNDKTDETANLVGETKKVEGMQSVMLTLWDTSDETDFSKDLKIRFMKKYPYIKLNVIIHNSDPGVDFYQGVAAGNAPDLCLFSLAVMEKYVREGILLPLDNYFKSWDESKYYVKKWLNGFTFNNKLYGIPYMGTTMLFGYNKKLFREAGITKPPETWDEMLDYAVKLTIPEKQQCGYNMLAAEWTEWWFQYYVWQAGGDLTARNPDGTLTLTFTDPAVIKAAKFYQQLRKAKVTQSDITLKFDQLIQTFAQGKAAMMPLASDWISWAISMGAKAEDIGIAPFPKGPAGKGTTNGGVGGCWGINAKSPKKVRDAAWKYIMFINAKENVIADFKWKKVNLGIISPLIIPRTDYSLSDSGAIDPEMVRILNIVAGESRPSEFYGKGVVGKYVDQAVQKIILDLNADPMKEFQKAQGLATKEVLTDFNKSVLKEK